MQVDALLAADAVAVVLAALTHMTKHRHRMQIVVAPWRHHLASAAAAAVTAAAMQLTDALAGGLISESDIDTAINRTLTMRFLTGQFDPPDSNSWSNLTLSTVNSREHRVLARRIVQEGIVLLKNTAPFGSLKPVLPLVKENLQKLCVLGPLSNSVEHMMGNYYGKFDAAAAATPLKGIQEELGGFRQAPAYIYPCSVIMCLGHAQVCSQAAAAHDRPAAHILVKGSSNAYNSCCR